jgi:hypothetical protein
VELVNGMDIDRRARFVMINNIEMDIEHSCTVGYDRIATRRKHRNGGHLTKILYITDVASGSI